jgi:hypothetical protein
MPSRTLGYGALAVVCAFVVAACASHRPARHARSHNPHHEQAVRDVIVPSMFARCFERAGRRHGWQVDQQTEDRSATPPGGGEWDVRVPMGADGRRAFAQVALLPSTTAAREFAIEYPARDPIAQQLRRVYGRVVEISGDGTGRPSERAYAMPPAAQAAVLACVAAYEATPAGKPEPTIRGPIVLCHNVGYDPADGAERGASCTKIERLATDITNANGMDDAVLRRWHATAVVAGICCEEAAWYVRGPDFEAVFQDG